MYLENVRPIWVQSASKLSTHQFASLAMKGVEGAWLQESRAQLPPVEPVTSPVKIFTGSHECLVRRQENILILLFQ